jgi:Ca-activated chloride channel family protein
LTLSHSVLLRLLDVQKPRSVPTECRTNIGDALAWGLCRLEGVRAPRKVIVLLSDGEHNVPPPALTPRQAAQLAANQHIPVYAIDASGDADVEEGLGREPATRTAADLRAGGTQTLQSVAQITGGRYFRARDTDSLLAVCREIDRLERRDIQSFIYQRYFEGYPWAGLAALVYWTLAIVLEATVWQRLP